jgi:hypothetical protein
MTSRAPQPIYAAMARRVTPALTGAAHQLSTRFATIRAVPENASPPNTSASAPLVAALRHVLRPLARLMLARGITFPFVSELLKQVLVEVAERQFQIDGKRQTDSRISLLSGVHRKDVRRLRRTSSEDSEETPESVSLGAQLAAVWTTSARFTDRHGRPKPLPRLASAGGDVSFESLVASVSKDIRSRAVLDEWIRLGVAHVDERDRVILDADAFIPEAGFEEKAFYLGHNLHDHAAAAAHNVLGEKPAFLERSVHYDALSARSVAEIATLARDAGMAAAKAVSRRAIELERKDAKLPARHRITFGLYFYSTPVAPSEEPSKAPRK